MNQDQLTELTAEIAEAKDAGFVTFCIDRKRLESLLARLADLDRLREAVESFDKSWGSGGMPGAVERFHHWQEVQAALAKLTPVALPPAPEVGR